MLDYIFANALSIMQLLIGIGVFIFCIFAARFFAVAAATLKKTLHLLNLIEHSITEPLKRIKGAINFVESIFR